MLFSSFSPGWRPTTIGHVDSATHALRCHWERAVDEERCDLILEATQTSWDAQVGTLGFAPPIADDDGRVDVYLTNDGTSGGGYTYGPYADQDDSDGRMGTFAYIAVDFGISDLDLPGYMAHEFTHVLQYGMDFTEPSLPMWEAVATAVEAWSNLDLHVVGSMVTDFQADPWVGLLQDGWMLWHDKEIWSEYEYGAALWIQHLDHHWGDGAGGGSADLWWASTNTTLTNEPDVLDAYDTITGDGEDALLMLSAERAQLGTDDAPPWAAQRVQARFRVVPAASLTVAELPTTVVPEHMPFETGVVYVELTDLPAGQSVEISVAAPGEIHWGAVSTEGTELQWVAEPQLVHTGAGGGVTLGIVHLGREGWDPDTSVTQADLSIDLALVDSPTGGDTGGAAPTGPTKDPVDEKGGCGCASAAPAGGLWLGLLGLIGLGQRRRGSAAQRGSATNTR